MVKWQYAAEVQAQLCEDYVRALARDLPPEKLAAAQTELSIVGCGEHQCIADYRKRTGAPAEFAFYCDPTRQVYQKLGMLVSYKQGQKPEYLSGKSLVGSTLSSILNAVASGRQALHSGKSSQNGGEWLFQGGQLQWCRRMRNTMDHAETKELKQVLGWEGEGKGDM